MRENWQIQSLTRNWWMRFRKISCEILGGKISRVTFLHTWPRLYMGVDLKLGQACCQNNSLRGKNGRKLCNW